MQKNHLNLSCHVAAFFLITSIGACGNNSFSGGTSSRPDPKKDDASQSESTSQSKAISGSSPSSTEDPSKLAAAISAAAIAACIKKWPNQPFTDIELTNPDVKTIDQLNNNNAVSFRDDKFTQKPKLVLVNITSKNVNKGKIELRNPNGWYCVDMESKSANSFIISVDCKAMVAVSHREHATKGITIDRPGC